MQRNLRRNDVNKRNSPVKHRRGIKRAETIKGGSSPYRHDGRDPASEVVKTLANGDADPSRLLELYYWTHEPGLVELIRAYLDLPEVAQRCLGDFLVNAQPQSVAATFDAQGRLVLSRPSTSEWSTADRVPEAASR